jgi:hypothetical protein
MERHSIDAETGDCVAEKDSQWGGGHEAASANAAGAAPWRATAGMLAVCLALAGALQSLGQDAKWRGAAI